MRDHRAWLLFMWCGAVVASVISPVASGGGGVLLESGCEGGGDAPFAAPGCGGGRFCGGPDSAGNSVYLFSGEFYHQAVDLRIRGVGFDFVWARKYRSRIGPSTSHGERWDFSYNIRIEQQGPDLLLFDGNSRQDVYVPQGDGTWATPEFFRVSTRNCPSDTDGNGSVDVGDLIQVILGWGPCDPPPALCAGDVNGDGSINVGDLIQVILNWGSCPESYTLTFPDSSTWNFHDLDGSPHAGTIASIVDRNGNTMGFTYDDEGRLATVTDTLDREITVAYNIDGLIESVTDFTGREVRYEYYQEGDADGGFGDLESVRSPVVIGTPNGNDFPDGKTTIYTYSTGSADENLNHNLLTITDPKGQVYLTNIYAPTQAPGNPDYDHVQRQICGDPGDIIDFFYVPEVPAEENNFADLRVIVNDRVGNVEEYFFAGNLAVILREYTGRWDPDQPTTPGQLAAPPPIPRLRSEDPLLFETQWDYNGDALPTRVTHPNQNERTFVYDEANASRRSQGNLLESCRLPGPLGGDQAQICQTYEYDDGFGAGCCGTNFVTRHVDGQGNETLNDYDHFGNRIHTQHRIPSIVEDWEYNERGQVTAHVLPDNDGHRRRDELTYYESGPMRGYMHHRIVDAPGLALTTEYEYNPRGAPTAVTDPNGGTMNSVLNQLDQVVRQLSRQVQTLAGAVRYELDHFYDANDVRVRTDVQNLDGGGVLQANTHFTTIRDTDTLNYIVRVCEEKGSHSVPPDQLDCGGLPSSEFRTTEYEYDANRNRSLVRYGEAVNGAQPTNTHTILHDERDLVFRRIRALGDLHASSDQRDYDGNRNMTRSIEGLERTPQVSERAFDGYDRIVSETDPIGNQTTHHYDANHNRVSSRLDGELVDVEGSAGNVRLSESTSTYDEMDRSTRREIEFFDPQTQTPIIAGDPPDSVVTTVTEWSNASLVTQVIDDNNHATQYSYDTALRLATTTDPAGNSKIHAYDLNSNVTSITEQGLSDLGEAPQEFTTTRVYDALDRLVTSIDNIGNETVSRYDSRNLQASGQDGRGNVVEHTYDGLKRLLSTTRMITDTGDGGGVVIDTITTTRQWDDSDRLTQRADDNGNVTGYQHDPLDRLIRVDHADCTERTYVYDVHDNQISRTDANGTTVSCSFDLLDREIARDVTPGLGVSSDTTFETRSYEGRSFLVSAVDDDSTVILTYDSLGNCDSEALNGQSTVRAFDGVGNELSCIYPGGRMVTVAYDELDLVGTISDTGGTIAEFFHVGVRPERTVFGNGTQMDYTWDGITGAPNPPGDFGVKQISRTKHTLISDASVIDDRTYAYDRGYNKTSRDNLVAGVLHQHGYDSIGRLITTLRTPPGAPDGLIQYDLDGVSNRNEVVGGPEAGTYTLDDTVCIPADAQMNQYTETPTESRGYDDNGNLEVVDAGEATERMLEYDYKNRLVAWHETATGVDVFFSYDCFGRRIDKMATGPLQGTTQTRYFYDGRFDVEEQDGLGVTLATFVRALGLGRSDAITPITMQRGGADYYFHCNDIGNIVTATDTLGVVLERYSYGDYGTRTVFDSEGEPIDASAIGNPYAWRGRRVDQETWLHLFGTRYLHSASGRFVSRAPMGDGDSWRTSMLGNAYAIFADNPWSQDLAVARGINVRRRGTLPERDEGEKKGNIGEALPWLAEKAFECWMDAMSNYVECASTCTTVGGEWCCYTKQLGQAAQCALWPTWDPPSTVSSCCEPGGGGDGPPDEEPRDSDECDCSAISGNYTGTCRLTDVDGNEVDCDCVVNYDCWSIGDCDCDCVESIVSVDLASCVQGPE